MLSKFLRTDRILTKKRFPVCPQFGRILFLGVLVIAGNMWFESPASGWERNTHRELTEKAIESVVPSLNTYLTDNLGLEGGINASFDGMTATQWMIEGSDLEDGEGGSITRPLNHFHESIQNKGLEIPVLGGISSIHWSLQAVGVQDGEDSYSWNDAREYYYKALTSKTKAERDWNWAKMFRALGQVMHLLQDSANPSHVRNDPHPFDEGLHDYMASRRVAFYLGNGIVRPDVSMLEQAGAVRSEPFSNLFDRNVYLGNNPVATLGTNIGITEIASANFFSDDTIPGQGGLFSTTIAYPSVTELVAASQSSPYLTLPRLGSAVFPGARAAKLTGGQAAAKFVFVNEQLDLLSQLQLDDAVYDAQAHHLIPRAVGYSAAVLDYFFRGELDITFQDFTVEGTLTPHPMQECISTPHPSEPNGNFRVQGTIPAALNFVGTGSVYYDREDGTRVLLNENTILASWNSFSGRGDIPHALVADPIRWTVVLEGHAGPGSPENRAIIAITDRVDWVFGCRG
ncbi:hypothetical protein [Candidatus Nitrospira salsa]